MLVRSRMVQARSLLLVPGLYLSDRGRRHPLPMSASPEIREGYERGGGRRCSHVTEVAHRQVLD